MVLIGVGLMIGGYVVRRESGGPREYFIGVDGRFSTSQTQAVLWTMVLAFSIGVLVLQPAFGSASSLDSSLDELDVTFLFLLGGPFAAAAAARAITATKASDGTTQKM